MDNKMGQRGWDLGTAVSIAAWLEDASIQFPDNVDGRWDVTIEAFRRAAEGIRAIASK